MNAADAMTSPVFTVSPGTPLQEVARLLLDRRISSVPVVEQQGNVLGLVSEADLLRLHDTDGSAESRTWRQRLSHFGASPLSGGRLQGLCAADTMTRGAVSVGEYTPLADVAQVLVQRKIHRVMVLSGRRLAGIITGSDMMRALLTLTRPGSEGWRADAAIEACLGARLEGQGWWDPSASHLCVDKGIVWFRGTVETEAARDAARLAAEKTPGVCGVLDDRICTATPEPWSSDQALEYVNA